MKHHQNQTVMTPTAETQRSFQVELARKRNDRAECIKKAWREGQTPDAAYALAANPDLAADRQLAIDLAYEEFCTRQEAGEELDADAFAARFSFCHSLRQLLNIHHLLDEHPDILDKVPTNWPSPGDALGDYLIVRELGRGGYSRVYLSEETTTGGRPVAIKISSAETGEAKTLGPLSHPHLIPVLSSPTIERWNVVVMPFAGSATLENLLALAWPRDKSDRKRSGQTILDSAASLVQSGDPPFKAASAYPIDSRMRYEDAVAVIAGSLFAAIAYLHENGLAHRDLKPTNVLLGESGHPYLLDFNLATSATDRIRMAGTLPYMSPEQLQLLTDEKATPPADWRPADLFSCGVVLFELLTGQHPFLEFQKHDAKSSQEKSASALLGSQKKGFTPLGKLNPKVGKKLRTAIERCLSFDPSRRPAAAELATSLAPRIAKRFNWRLTLASVFALCVLVSLLVGLFWSDSKRQDDPPAQQSDSDQQLIAVPTDPMERGLQFYRRGDLGFAINEFVNVGKEHNNGQAFAFAAYCYSLRRDHRSAEHVADLAIQMNHDVPAVYVNRAYTRLQLAKFSDAKADCNRVLATEPNLREARYLRINVNRRLVMQGKTRIPEAMDDATWMGMHSSHPSEMWVKNAQLLALLSGDNALREKMALALRETFETGAIPIYPEVWLKICEKCGRVNSDNSALRQKATDSVREAILTGTTPDSLESDPVFRANLARDANYRSSLQLTPGTKQKTENNIYLINPIPNP